MISAQRWHDKELTFESFVIMKTLTSIVAFVMSQTRLAYDMMDMDGVGAFFVIFVDS